MYTVLYMSRAVVQGKAKVHTLRLERADCGTPRVKVDGVLYYRVHAMPCKAVSKFVQVWDDAGNVVGY